MISQAVKSCTIPWLQYQCTVPLIHNIDKNSKLLKSLASYPHNKLHKTHTYKISYGMLELPPKPPILQTTTHYYTCKYFEVVAAISADYCFNQFVAKHNLEKCALH